MLDPHQLKKDFPIFQRKFQGKELIYLDSGATTQKPQVVIDAITDYYTNHVANVHRGVYELAEESSTLWETSHHEIAEFFGADDSELIITRNTTESTNGVAYGWGDHQLKAGDVVLVSLLEHHSNLVVWQELCKRTGAILKIVKLTADGELDVADLQQKLTEPAVRLVALTYVSNVLGTITPLEGVVKAVKKYNKQHADQPPARIMLDAAQAAPHLPVNFSQLGVDFLAFSGHKLYGPMGIGGLIVKHDIISSGELKPWFFGGGMIEEVTETAASFAESAVDRFTPGTPDVASVVGLAAACRYLKNLGMAEIKEHSQRLVAQTIARLSEIPEVTVLGPKATAQRVGSVAFLYHGVHPHDAAQVLAHEGVAIRSGHHCAMPLHLHFHWPATMRATFSLYNSEADVEALVAAVKKIKTIFQRT